MCPLISQICSLDSWAFVLVFIDSIETTLFHCLDQLKLHTSSALFSSSHIQMASHSPLLMVYSQDTTSKVQAVSNQEASRSEQPSKLPRGRKPSKTSKSPVKKNKPSQRGMGVERLERLRLQEKWGGSLPAEVVGFPLNPHTHQFQALPASPHIPMAPSPYVVGSDLSRSSSEFMAHKVSVLSGVACGSNVTRDWVGGMLETSCKELSSIPKVVQCHQYDAYCSKNKKSMNMEEMQGMILGGKDKIAPSMINCHVLTGLNHGQNVGVELKDLNLRAMRQIYHQESELMGITRQPSVFGERPILSSSTVLKEYEFFPPGKGLKEYEFFPGTSSGVGYTRSSEQPNHYTEAASSYFIPSDYNQYNAASSSVNNAIDLSLKLSL